MFEKCVFRASKPTTFQTSYLNGGHKGFASADDPQECNTTAELNAMTRSSAVAPPASASLLHLYLADSHTAAERTPVKRGVASPIFSGGRSVPHTPEPKP